MSLESRKIGGCESYFEDATIISLSNGRSYTLRDFNAWSKDTMSLLKIKETRSAFRAESHSYDVNDKCYQLRLFIRKL